MDEYINKLKLIKEKGLNTNCLELIRENIYYHNKNYGFIDED
jgi:hypothetical protein